MSRRRRASPAYQREPPLQHPLLTKDARSGAKTAREAIVVCHGMGQQVPFKTLDDVAKGLHVGDRVVERRARQVRIGDERLGRLELKMKGADGPREVDVYEVYWAPITEGLVTLRDTLRFLFGAAGRGLAVAVRRGRHHRFGELVPVGGGLHVVTIALVLLQVLSVLALTAATTFMVGGAVPGYGSFAEHEEALLSMLLFLVPAALFALAFWTRLPVLGWPALVLLLVATPVAAVTVWLHLLRPEWVPSWLDVASLAATVGLGAPVAEAGEVVARRLGLASVLILGVMVWVTRTTRRFAIAYVGDVAAYVTPHKLDRFAEVRGRIKECANAVGMAVYGAAGPDGAPLYGKVSVVGHSLGSVVAYDLLNKLILEDQIRASGPTGAAGGTPRLDIVGRTRLLLTFGSPLDKIAWFFRSNVTADDLDGREVLAASVQPLICDYDVRPFRWVNVYSRADPISGALHLFDKDVRPPNPVRNVPDRQARFPLAAHTAYWKGDTVWAHLVENVLDLEEGTARPPRRRPSVARRPAPARMATEKEA